MPPIFATISCSEDNVGRFFGICALGSIMGAAYRPMILALLQRDNLPSRGAKFTGPPMARGKRQGRSVVLSSERRMWTTSLCIRS